MSKIAISVIAFNRITSLKRLLESLEQGYYHGEEVPLVISVDKSDTDAVELFAERYQWHHGPKTVVKHRENMGLRRHILSQGNLFEQYDAIIVLEDDIVVAPDFWNFAKQSISKYEHNDKIAGISLYSFAVNYHLRQPFTPMHDKHDAYFMNCAMSWGQVWMKRQWRAFETWYNEHLAFPTTDLLPHSIQSWGEKSWLKYHTRYCIEQNKYFVFPYISYTTNFSETGTHINERVTLYQVPLLHGHKEFLSLPDFGSDAVYYDGFFENKALYKILGFTEEECCLDLSNSSETSQGKRYWLTRKQLPYKIIKEFDFGFRPIEENIINGCEGHGIYLYDTTIPAKRPENNNRIVFLSSFYILNVFLFIREYGYMNVIKDFINVVKDKFNIK